MDETGSDLLNFIKGNEGFGSKEYLLDGIWHIGHGHNIEARGLPGWIAKPVFDKTGITEQQGERLLIEDLDDVIAACGRIISNFDKLSPWRQIAMVDMCFAMGATGLTRCKRILGSIEKGVWSEAAFHAMDTNFYRNTGLRGIRVVRMIREGFSVVRDPGFHYSPHLTQAEIACHCGGLCDGGFIVPELALRFEQLRQLCCQKLKREVPLHVNSGFRCPAYNDKVAKTGRKGPHTLGVALDIACPEGMDYEEFYALCLIVFHDGGVGRYANKGFVHVDVRGEEARWEE